MAKQPKEFQGKLDSYVAVDSLSGSSGSYYAKSRRTGAPYCAKAYDGCTVTFRDYTYPREVEILEELKPLDIAPKLHDTGSTRPLLVTEWIEGKSLSEVIDIAAPATPQQTTLIIKPIAKALAKAHAIGIIHRDVKPDNIMYPGCDGSIDIRAPILGDWGAAYNKHRHKNEKTDVGTLRYLAPETIFGDVNTNDERSDIYSLGVIMFELLSGSSPYSGMFDEPQIALAKLQPHDPRKRNPDTDSRLGAVATRMTDPNPTLRHQCLDEVIEDLDL